jgi:hypothetical protein
MSQQSQRLLKDPFGENLPFATADLEYVYVIENTRHDGEFLWIVENLDIHSPEFLRWT